MSKYDPASESKAMFGVCTLRAEVQPEHLLITVTTCRSPDLGAQRVFSTRPRCVASTEEALAIAEEFLAAFGAWQDPPALP